MKWLSDNWDKVFSVILSSIIAGVIGFFSAISVIKSDIQKVENRIIEVEKDIAKRTSTDMENINEKISCLMKDITEIKTARNYDKETLQELTVNAKKVIELETKVSLIKFKVSL